MKRLFAFTRSTFRSQSIYILDFWASILSMYIMMYGMYSLWQALYIQNPDAFGVNLEQMTTYGVLSILLPAVTLPATKAQTYIAQQVRTGVLELDIIKPIGFVILMLSRNGGEFIVQLFLKGIPGAIFAYLILDIQIPTIQAGFNFAISLLLGYLIYFFLNLLMGMLSILTLDIRSYGWAFNALIRFASGQFVPIWMFPAPLATLLTFLPFQAIYFVPLSIYVGTETYGQTLIIQLFWLIALYAIACLIWRQLYKRISIQGG